MTEWKNGKPVGAKPVIKFIIGEGVAVEKVGDSKPPKYASTMYRTVQ